MPSFIAPSWRPRSESGTSHQFPCWSESAPTVQSPPSGPRGLCGGSSLPWNEIMRANSLKNRADDRHEYRTRLYQGYVRTCQSYLRPSTLETHARMGGWYHSQFGRFLPPDHGAAILDVGCGDGALVRSFQQAGYTNVRGIDLSREQVALANSLGVQHVEEAAAQAYLDAHRGEFRLITVVDVLEHLDKNEVLAFLDALYGALEVGGAVLIHTVNAASPFGGYYHYGDFTHELAFTSWSIEQVLREAGFGEIQVMEVQPAQLGPVSKVRYALWQVIRAVLCSYLAIETGVVRGHVLTQNLIAVARRV